MKQGLFFNLLLAHPCLVTGVGPLLTKIAGLCLY